MNYTLDSIGDRLLLTKNQEIIRAKYDEDKDEHYKETIIPERILFFLEDMILLEDGFTLRDYFRLVDHHYPFKLIDPFFECFLEEFDVCPNDGCVDEDGEIEYLLLNRYASYECSKTLKTSVDLGLESDSDKEDLQFDAEIETSIDFHAFSEKKDIPYGLDFVPLNQILDHEIKIGNARVSIELEGNYEDYEHVQDKFIYRTAPDVGYSLYEFIKSIIWELSFYGCSDNRQEQSDIIRQRINDVEENYNKISNNNSDEID